MYSMKSRVEMIVRALMTAIIIFNASVPATAAAMSTSAVEASVPSMDAHGAKGSAVQPYQGLSARAEFQDITPTATPTPEIPLTPTLVTSETPTAEAIETAIPSTEVSTSIAETDVASILTETPLPVATDMVFDTPLLSLVATPDTLTADSTLVLDWIIEGVALDNYKSLSLQITLPDELSLQEGHEGEYDQTTRTLTISITALSGQITLLTGASVSDTKLSALLLDGTEMLTETSLYLPIQEKFVVDRSGGDITTNDGNIRIEFPSNTFSERTVINVGSPSNDAMPEYLLMGQPFEITAYEEQSETELSRFSEELKISVSYADLGIPQALEGDLHLYWYNPETKDWEGLPSRVDKETKTLIAYTDHFTVFDMDVNNWQASHLPTVDSFQVSSFTGAATYSYPIEVPPGPGGLQPSVSLNYNSQVVDQSTLQTQASWVGMGWSLETGSIELDTHGTPNWMYDDTLLLNVAGVSTRIVKDPSGVYHAADENFWKITYSSGAYIVKDTQGNTYTFGKIVNYPYKSDACNDDWMTHRWMLTKVTNIFGQEINYTYTDQTKQIQFWENCIWNWATATTATYPSTITYAGGRYGIWFDRGTDPNRNRQDYTSAWDTDLLYHAYEKYRLENIYVMQDSDGNGTLETVIRRYALSYAANSASDIIFPGYQWSAGGKTTTLKTVQQYGVGGTTSLPSTTFTYGDNLHLTRADNGYGGQVEFDYELWYYASDARASYSVENIFGDYGNMPCFDGVPSPWYIRTGFGGCAAREPLYLWGTTGVATAGHMNNHSASVYQNKTKDLVRPGGVYKLTASIGLASGMSLRVGLYDGIRDNWQNTGSPYFVTLPADANKAEPIIEETGGGLSFNSGKYATIWSFKMQLLTSIYRVKEKRVKDGNSHTYPFTYSYLNSVGADSAGVNDTTLSATTCPPIPVNGSPSCYGYFERYSEFRGHGYVTEIGPDGTKTITQFYQDDIKKGRPSLVRTNNGSEDLSRVDYSYVSTSLPMAGLTVAECSLCSSYIGLSRNWVYTDAQATTIYGSVSAAKRVDYDYESTYGNLILETEQSWESNDWVTYRKKEYNYFPTNSATQYLVSLPARVATLDSAGNVLASMLYLYDNNNDYTTPPAYGKLTATRVKVKSDGSQWSQVSYGYDTWGNQSSITTYSSYASSFNTNPPNGAATTTTVFDPTYHVYPISTTNALNQTTNWTYDYTLGVPLTESDANDTAGNDTTISAVYDGFRRMTKLIRPGDSTVSPTITISYQDSFPFTTTITQKIDSTNSYTVQRVYDGMGRQTKMVSGGSIVDTVYVSPTQTKQSLPYFSGEAVYYSTTNVNPTAHTTTVSAPDGTSTITYNNGLTTIVTDARGNSTTTKTDVWGRTISVVPPTGPNLAYAYNQLDQLVTATRGGNATPSEGSNPSSTGLVSWWTMSETGGMRYDSHSTNHLTDNNTVANATGLRGNAASFLTANQERLTIADNSSVSTGDIDFSLLASVYLNNTTSSFVIVDKSDNTNNFEYRLSHTTSGFRFRVGTSGGTYVDSGPVQPNTWYTIVAWHDSVNNTLNLQVNNGAVKTVSYAGGSPDTTNPLSIGAISDGTAGLDGRIDEVALYKRVLTLPERKWLYNDGSGPTYSDINPSGANPGTTDLSAWWQLNETSGTRNDSYGSNHLTDNNTVTSVASLVGNAAQFSAASTEYLSVPDNASLSMGDVNFTICAWAFLNNKAADRPIVAKWDPTTNNREYFIAYDQLSDRFVFMVSSDGITAPSATATANNLGSPLINTWYYICAWHDAVNNSINIQVNNGTPNSTSISTGVYNGAASLDLGRRRLVSSQAYMDGRVDEAVIYKRILTDSQRTWLYNNTGGRAYSELNPPVTNPGTTSLTSWWTLNESSGTRYDSHGTNNLTDNNTVSYTFGLKENAAKFKTANQERLTITDNPSISTGDIDFTLVASVFLNNTTNSFVIVDKSDNTNNFEYRLSHTTSGFRFRVGGNGASTYVDSGPVSPNTWYTIVAWHDSVNNTLNIQVNNGAVKTVAYSGGSPDTTNPLSIGATPDGMTGLDGRIDEAALYKRVLTASERAWLYNNGNRRTYLDVTGSGPITPPAPVFTTTTISYDLAGRKTAMSDPDMGNWTYGYDALGNLTSQTDARLCTLNLGYDSLNRLTSKSSGNDADCVTQVNTAYTYDFGTNGVGSRTKAENTIDNIVSEWTYDIRGRLKTETVMGYTTEWDYNAADMPIWMEYPDGEVVAYDYDARMLLDKVHDTKGTLSNLSDDYYYVASTTYDSAGRLDLRTFGNGTQTDHTYYPWTAQGGRMQTLRSGTVGNPTSLQDLAYTYDTVGNISQISNTLDSESSSYGYDPLDRLTGWALNGTTENYSYDTATGNLSSKASTALTYNAQVTCSTGNRTIPHAVSAMSANTYVYDCNGNQSTRVIGTDTYNLRYDAENRLVEVKKNNAVIATFTYDGDGKRVKSTINGTTTTFLGGHYEITASTITKYYFAGAARVAMKVNGTASYLISDHLGGTSITTDTSGNLVSEIRYKPWGEVRYPGNGQNPGPSNYTYTGQYSYVSDFGLYFYSARWYDPALGRFAQADTIIPQNQGVQAWDRYAYTNNNPVRYTDPSGHCVVGGHQMDDSSTACQNTKSSPKPRVFYLNGLGGRSNLVPARTDGHEYQAMLYYIQLAVGDENSTHVPVFTNGFDVPSSQLDMLGEALGIDNNWTEDALNLILDDLASDPLENGQSLVIVGSSAGGTVAIELLDDLQAEGVFVDQVILRGSLVVENTLVNVGRVDYITAENPYTDEYYSVDTNPFDAVTVQEHRIQGLSGHETAWRGVMNQIGTLVYNLILGVP